MSTMVPEDAPKPRLCHVKKRDDFSGYGFNLHAEKGKAGQYIGKVDPGSPAERTKLKEGDRIVEVNGTNIGNENHQQVVQRIKAIPDETKLLVVDSETDNYYKEKKIVVRGDMPNLLCLSSDGTSEINTTVTNGEIDARPSSTASSNEVPADAPKPRYCHIKIWPNFQGYGFNLHAEKGKPGQFIGNVDEGSPSELAGLKEGDRIIEVNGENIAKDNHSEVVKKIKSDPKQTKMLVLDPEAEKYYRERNITVSSTQDNVIRLECPDIKPEANGGASPVEAEINHVDAAKEDTSVYYGDDNEDKISQSSEPISNNVDNEIHPEEAEDKAEVVAEYANVSREVTETSKEAPQPSEPEPEQNKEEKEEKVELNNNADVAENYDIIANVPKQEAEEEKPREPSPKPSPEPVRAPTPEPPKEEKLEAAAPESPTKNPVTIGGVTFAGSAKEAREKMNKKQRDSVKQQHLSSKEKYNLYMKM